MDSHKVPYAVRQANGCNDVTDLKDQQVGSVLGDNVKMLKAGRDDMFGKGPGRQHTCLRWFKRNLFLLLTFAGIITGLILGLTVRKARPSADALVWIGMPGELYMRILQSMILPLIFCTVIDGTANTDPKSNGRIGLVTMAYIVSTNTLGVIVGIVFSLIIKPGRPTLIWVPNNVKVSKSDLRDSGHNIRQTASSNIMCRAGKHGRSCLAISLDQQSRGSAQRSCLDHTTWSSHPGSMRADDDGVVVPDTRNLRTVDIFADFIRNIFPDNIVSATMQMAQTKYTQKDVLVQTNASGFLVNTTSVQLARSLTTVSGTNILGLIVVSAAIGVAASQAGEKTRQFIDFFSAGARVIYKLFEWAKWTTPVGVASLIALALAKVENIQTTFSSMGMFLLTTIGGCLVYQWLILPAILVVLTRRNPLTFISHAIKPCILAFGPASSAITLPEMIRISQEVYRVDPRVAGCTLPFCVTLNRDASCLFIAATCLFVAQYSGTSLGTGDVFIIAILTAMSSLAIPAVPSSSIVVILIILGTLGISSQSMGLVMAVEWLNDRVRTTTNVCSHMVGALVTWRFCRASLSKNIQEAQVHVFTDDEDL